eukprot:5915520-Pyramimonas_sp.AAC.1
MCLKRSAYSLRALNPVRHERIKMRTCCCSRVHDDSFHPEKKINGLALKVINLQKLSALNTRATSIDLYAG